MEERLCSVNSRTAFEARLNPDPRDDLLLDELRRSVEVMPLDLDTVKRLVSSLKKISDNSRGELVDSKVSAVLLATLLLIKPVNTHCLFALLILLLICCSKLGS